MAEQIRCHPDNIRKYIDYVSNNHDNIPELIYMVDPDIPELEIWYPYTKQMYRDLGLELPDNVDSLPEE